MENIFNEIVREIKGHTNEVVDNAKNLNTLEFGNITSTGLELDNFKYEIKDYLVLDYLKLDRNNFSNTIDGLHTIATPSNLRPLEVGDRVLVATISKEFVVVGRI